MKTASEIITEISSLDLQAREARIIDLIKSGNVPTWQRPENWRLVKIQEMSRIVEILVSPDYVTVGTDEDFLRYPMTPGGAQDVATSLNAVLPTPKMVDKIYADGVRVEAHPFGPPYTHEAMQSLQRWVEHNGWITSWLTKNVPDALVGSPKPLAGHKKDVVITNRLLTHPKSVAIYGWHGISAKPIQSLFLGHSDDYVDYSHGIRLVSERATIDGKALDIRDILTDWRWSPILSSEGPLKISL